MKKQLLKIIFSLTAVIFAVSCGSNNDSPTNPDQGEFTVNIDTFGLSQTDVIIGTSSEKTSFIKEGKIKCYPGTEAKVEINKVTAVSGGVSLEPADFEVVTPTVTLTANEIRIKLSASGIEKVRKATAGEVSEYTFTFLFTRTSDNKTATSDGKLKVANIDIINQTDIETTMKKVKGLDSGDLEGNLVITDENNNKCLFLLSGFTLDKNTAYESTASGVTNPVSADKAKSNIFLQTYKDGKYGFYFNPDSITYTIDFRKTKATFTIKASLKDGYMFDDAVSYVTTDGFKLVLNLQGGGTWK